MKKLFYKLIFVLMALSLGYLLLDKFAPEKAKQLTEKIVQLGQNVQKEVETQIEEAENKNSADNDEVDLDSSEFASGEISESVQMLNDEWSLYENEKLGFLMKIPQKVTITKCNSDRSEVEVGTMFYANETSAYLLNSDRYNQDSCEKIFNSFDDVLEKKIHHWEITPRTIKNENELQSLIKEKYGEKCNFKSLEPSTQEGVYDVKIEGTSPEGGCFLNWAFVFKYFPEGKKAVQWNIGQDTNFRNGKTSYDKAIVDSFRFLNSQETTSTNQTNNEDKIKIHVNTNSQSNIPLIITAENGESLTIFKNFAGDKEYIDKVVIQTAEGKNATITANIEGYPVLVESGTSRVSYSNYNFERGTVDVEVNLNGEHNSYKDVKIDLSTKISNSPFHNFFIEKAYAIPVSPNTAVPMGVDPNAQQKEKSDYYIGTVGQIWSVVSCGGGIGLTVISGGTASPMLYLSCGVFLTRVVTSNMDIGPCSGDVMECAKDAVVEVFTHDGERQYTHEVIPEEENKQPEVILDLNPEEDKIITDGVYQAPIQRTKDNNGLTDTISGTIKLTFQDGVGSCEMAFDSKASGVPNLPSDVDLPAGTTIPAIEINSKIQSTECSGDVNQTTGKFNLKGSASFTSNTQGLSGVENGTFSVTGQITGANISGEITFGATGDVIDF